MIAWQPGEYALQWSDGSRSAAAVKDLPRALELQGPWQVRFFEKWGPEEPVRFEKLSSWTGNPNAQIRYYSGTAEYRKSFNIPADHQAEGMRSFLDLGRVWVIAEVRLNGRNLGVLWKPPYRVEITDAVKAGQNDLEIEITNLWPNRLIGDEKIKDKNQRFTSTTYKHFDQDSPLFESGLLGPVQVLAAKEVEIAKP